MAVEGVWRRFDRSGPWVLQDASLALGPGQAVLLAGPSGCGKTTLLNLAGGIDRADRGRVVLGGTDLGELSEADRAAARVRCAGFVFQHHLLSPGDRARDAVAGPLVWGLGMPPRRALALADEWLDRVGLAEFRRAAVQRLSGGQRQRVALARCLAAEPKLLLADEPTAQLDAATAELVQGLLREAVEQRGAALLIVSHEAEAADWPSARRMALRDGRLAEG